MKPEQVKTSLAIILTRSKKFTNKLQNITISTNADYEVAAKNLSLLKAELKSAQELRKGFMEPLKVLIANTDSLFKPFITLVSELETRTKEAMVGFLEAQEARKAKIVGNRVKSVKEAIKALNSLEVTSDFAQIRSNKSLLISEASCIPRKYLIPNEALIKEALLAGKKVPGCSIVTNKVIAV